MSTETVSGVCTLLLVKVWVLGGSIDGGAVVLLLLLVGGAVKVVGRRTVTCRYLKKNINVNLEKLKMQRGEKTSGVIGAVATCWTGCWP